MKVDTYLFGSVEVDPEKVLTFSKGLVGFENCKRFMLVHEAGKGQPSSFTLQSLDDPIIAFQIADPANFGLGYELELTDEEVALLQSPAAEDIQVMQVLFKSEQDGKAAIAGNFGAPLLINTRARVGIQKVMGVCRPSVTLSNLVSSV